jgi:hypothetical protein
MRRWFSPCARLLVLISAAPGPLALAASLEGQLAVGYDARITDNVLRAPDDANPEEGVIHLPYVSVGAGVEEQRTRLESNYLARARFFTGTDVRDDNVVTGSTSLAYDVVPRRLVWNASHQRIQQLADPRFVDNPLNQQELDTLSTGLDYRLFARGATAATLQANLSRQSAGFARLDSTRGLVAADLSHALSEQLTAGVFADFTDVDFDAVELPDFQRVSGGVSAGWTGRRTSLSVRAGLNEVDRGDLGSNDGYLLTAQLSFAPTEAQRLSASVEQRLTDQGQQLGQGGFGGLFGPGVGGIGDGFRDQFAFGSVFETRGLSVDYAVGRGRWNTGLRFDVREQEFESAGAFPDFSRATLTARGGYELTERLSFALTVSFLRNEFDAPAGGFGQPSREDEQVRVLADLRWRPGPRTTASVGVEHFQSDSDAGFFNFEETALLLQLRRVLVGQGGPAPARVR